MVRVDAKTFAVNTALNGVYSSQDFLNMFKELCPELYDRFRNPSKYNGSDALIKLAQGEKYVEVDIPIHQAYLDHPRTNHNAVLDQLPIYVRPYKLPSVMKSDLILFTGDFKLLINGVEKFCYNNLYFNGVSGFYTSSIQILSGTGDVHNYMVCNEWRDKLAKLPELCDDSMLLEAGIRFDS